MRKFCLLVLALFVANATVNAQTFPESIEVPEDFAPLEILLPQSPLSMQVLFVGGSDWVQTTPTYGYEAGQAYAKEWHDFIGFTADETGESLGWVSVNHESIYQDDRIGDGGGMTTFRVAREGDSLVVVEQTLEDGRQGKFFNVDFVNTVGETGMNCGGIVSSVDGRIWTAEEWFRSDLASINNGRFRSPSSTSWYPKSPGTAATNQGVRDTAAWTISTDITGWVGESMDGLTVKKNENFNYMVEIDPRQAVAVRKQYNWGRQGFEGGVVTRDNKYVYLGIDATPCFWSRFVADTPGDFTQGVIEVYKADAAPGSKWIVIEQSVDNMLNFTDAALAVGATMYNRAEWVAIDTTTGYIYWTETGRDGLGSRWAGSFDNGGTLDQYHIDRAAEMGTTATADDYTDYYGRVWVYNPDMDTQYVHIEGGPAFDESPSVADYPDKHMTNPDGLSVMYIGAEQKPFLVICEDLNGTSFGRMPAGISNRFCELFLLDLSIENATVNDLIRISAIPAGAEVTGACPTSDGKSLLVNSQHPNSNNPYPFNHSLTYVINGFDNVTTSNLTDLGDNNSSELRGFPIPVEQSLNLNKVSDYALYNMAGQRLKVFRNTKVLNLATFAAGVYFVVSAENETLKVVIE